MHPACPGRVHPISDLYILAFCFTQFALLVRHSPRSCIAIQNLMHCECFQYMFSAGLRTQHIRPPSQSSAGLLNAYSVHRHCVGTVVVDNGSATDMAEPLRGGQTLGAPVAEKRAWAQRRLLGDGAGKAPICSAWAYQSPCHLAE
jgi:hypothetical protein